MRYLYSLRMTLNCTSLEFKMLQRTLLMQSNQFEFLGILLQANNQKHICPNNNIIYLNKFSISFVFLHFTSYINWMNYNYSTRTRMQVISACITDKVRLGFLLYSESPFPDTCLLWNSCSACHCFVCSRMCGRRSLMNSTAFSGVHLLNSKVTPVRQNYSDIRKISSRFWRL